MIATVIYWTFRRLVELARSASPIGRREDGGDLGAAPRVDGARRQVSRPRCTFADGVVVSALTLVLPAIAWGIATAAGCQLVASCDLAVAAEATRFATPGVKIGLFCSTPMVAVSRAVGRKRALELLLTGEAIDASTARDWELINRVVSADELEDAVSRRSWRGSRRRAHSRCGSACRRSKGGSSSTSTGATSSRDA